jgi:aldehyde dehydrogenase (NAD+)
MTDYFKFYTDGEWTDPVLLQPFDVINPSNEEVCARISLGTAADVDHAVAAALQAFESFSQTTREERIALLMRVLEVYKRREQDVADAMTLEMGAPKEFAMAWQAGSGTAHLESTIEVLKSYEFERLQGTTLVVHEAIGVVGMITPWNWPINQIVCKVAPALAAGCTMVLKPSEIAPLSGIVWTEIMHEAGVPKGVFNLVQGDGPTVGAAIAAHPGIDMVSFTGSTRGGIAVAKAAADTVKRVAQELGGNSANILLDDVDFETAVTNGVAGCYLNSGESCDSPQRMLVPHSRMNDAMAIAKRAAESYVVGDPNDPKTTLGPLISKPHWEKVQGLIKTGIEDGATLVTGGLGLPEGLNRGYFARPTIFGNVTPSMRIANLEIFGMTMLIIGYSDEDEAVRIANDTEYGLAGYVQGGNLERARKVARRLRVGAVQINYPAFDPYSAFGGYKQSGNGREYGAFGLHDYLETKCLIGYN